MPERLQSRVDAELPLLLADLRKWVAAHLTPSLEIGAALDPEGTHKIAVWLVTDHTGVEDSASRIVYEPIADAFGIAIGLQNGITWFQGAHDSLADAVNNM